ncbi:PDS5, Hypothetical protein cohesion maintenance, homolog [Nesidiocoris tenuis]|uniref:Uncharacterized protein n=1 Tax=Nesidiocoris tenuis TaxID=355587 RepID=A0ABN7BB45_9HEMI|nr:PDS5, Hypothetical protein cohesion maintenance, homolog [Nesidiocoris tenuis]
MPQGDIVYPQGCRPISEDLSPDELIRRLKTLAHTLQAMGQDEGMYQPYIPLALHLADDHFLSHESKDVQLLIACCIADVLRVYAPQAPYKDPERVKIIFMFLIKQLSGLKDPKDPAFKRYFYLLENLAYVKSFNMCFELEDCQEIFCNLFSLMFKIVNDEHSGKVKSFMLDVLCPLITESDIVSNELLDIILANIVEPAKSQRKNAYLLAKELVVKTCDTLEPYIQAFFNNVLLLGREEKGFTISGKVYDLIYELYKICPSVLLAVMPQLEVKLKSANDDQRLGAVSLLARMFSEKDSNLAQTHTMLWQSFLGRFNDINVFIRIKCVQYSMHFLLNHPELRKDITETLKLRQHDSEENVRYEVVMAIVSTAKRDFEVVSESEDLLEFVKERMLDKKFKIRKEAMTGLAMIYRKHLSDPNVPQATKKAVTWIKDKILHGYYMSAMEDRILVERLLNTSLVPFHLPPAERMKKLYYLLATVDSHANKAFLELQKHYVQARRLTAEWLSLHRLPASPEREKDISARIVVLSKLLPDQVKAQEFLGKFSQAMFRDQTLLQGMEVVMKPDITCKECAETTSLILKKLGQPIMTNLYYNTVKMLLERTSSVMVDRESIYILVEYVEDCLKNGNMIEEIGLHPNTAGEQGLKILVLLAYVFPIFFYSQDTMNKIVGLIDLEGENTAPLVMEILVFLGKYKHFVGQRMADDFPEQMTSFIPKVKEYSMIGTPKQAKQAVRCLFINLGSNDSIFNEILDKLRENLNPESPHYLTSIVALGHLAHNLPEKFPVHIKNIVSRKIVKELLVKNTEGDGSADSEAEWCEKEELPFETLCKVEGLKAMGRWLVGLKKDKLSAQKTFRMLSAFIANKGDLLQNGKLSKVEMAWLRLAAGCAMLKICEVKCVGDQYHPDQFYTLSLLAHDDVAQVRERFLQKFHHGLLKGVPTKCLPLDFMGMFAVYGMEKEKKLRIKAKQFMQTNIAKRREYAKGITMGTMCDIDKGVEQLYNLMPDYMIVFAIAILAHSPAFTSLDDHEVLTRMRNCIWFVLEPLLFKNDFYSFYFYRELLEKLKTYKDALNPDNEIANMKIYTLADLTLHQILIKNPNADYKDFSLDTRISTLYFKPPDDPLAVNIKIYIPVEFQHVPQDAMTSSMKQVKPQTNVVSKATSSGTGSSASGAKGATGVLRKGDRKALLRKGVGPNENDAKPAAASETQIKVDGLDDEDGSEGESTAPAAKKLKSSPAAEEATKSE